MNNEKTEKAGGDRTQNLVVGGGIAGIVTALELLEGGQSVTLLDADSRERFGGLALWAFGGMALVGTPEQRRMGIDDSPARALEDWIRFGELTPEDEWPLAWARCYVEESRTAVYDWVRGLGLKFMPAVNWVERGSAMPGNTAARYHILWGTGRELVQAVSDRLRSHPKRGRLTLLHRHRATRLIMEDGVVAGCSGVDLDRDQTFEIRADRTVVASGGINGSEAQVRRHWPSGWPEAPGIILNGANPLSDGNVHQAVAEAGGCLDHLSDMWNYAAGIPHPQPHFDGHGLSLIPCKSALWLTPDGEPVGPAPMVTGYDTREMCRQVVAHPYTWQVLNWKIAKKELAISGAEHNPRIVKHQMIRFLGDLLFGNRRLVRQMLGESTEFLAADSLDGLVTEMNALTGEDRIDPGRMLKRVARRDQALADPVRSADDPDIGRILRAREWRPDALRTCNLQAIGASGAAPYIAIRLHFVSRKSLGGIRTNLEGRVLTPDGSVVPGLYAVGESAGFGGGGASGKRSLEGTFLSGCILTARKAAAAILAA
ncbi:MAG: FAD-binding protein [Xanthomonadales bacterium]|nr:FAD-binding protein [Xanthomonadales bacterium]